MTSDCTRRSTKPMHPKACCFEKPARRAESASYDPCQPNIKIPRKVIKGGSHLCAPNYCRRYRPPRGTPRRSTHLQPCRVSVCRPNRNEEFAHMRLRHTIFRVEPPGDPVRSCGVPILLALPALAQTGDRSAAVMERYGDQEGHRHLRRTRDQASSPDLVHLPKGLLPSTMTATLWRSSRSISNLPSLSTA